MIHLGSIYLVVNDFEKSIEFYEKLLELPLGGDNNGRFVSFEFEGHCISLLNGRFDAEHPNRVTRKGETNDSAADLLAITHAPNTHKFVFNFWAEDLRAEHRRLRELNISEDLTAVYYFCYVAPYYYFQLTDPDGNVIEVTGSYAPEEGDFA